MCMYTCCVWGGGSGRGCLRYWVGFLSSFFFALSIRYLLVCYTHVISCTYVGGVTVSLVCVCVCVCVCVVQFHIDYATCVVVFIEYEYD